METSDLPIFVEYIKLCIVCSIEDQIPGEENSTAADSISCMNELFTLPKLHIYNLPYSILLKQVIISEVQQR